MRSCGDRGRLTTTPTTPATTACGLLLLSLIQGLDALLFGLCHRGVAKSRHDQVVMQLRCVEEELQILGRVDLAVSRLRQTPPNVIGQSVDPMLPVGARRLVVEAAQDFIGQPLGGHSGRGLEVVTVVKGMMKAVGNA